MTERLVGSLFFLIGFFFFRIAGAKVIKEVKNFHEKNNPERVEKLAWFFKFGDFFFKAFSIICLIFMLCILTGIMSIDK